MKHLKEIEIIMESTPIVIYLSPYDILRPRTNQVSDVRFSEGFSQNGCEVHFITPFVYRSDNITKEKVQEVYGLESPIQIHYLATYFKKDISGKFSSYLLAFLTTLKVFRILKRLPHNRSIYLISRSAYLLQALLSIRKIFSSKFKSSSLIFWAHDFKHKSAFLKVYKECDYLLATNSSIIDDLCKLNVKSIEKTHVTLNPITKAQSEFNISKEDARKIVGIDKINEPLLVYTGKVAIDYNEELEYILKAVAINPQIKFLCTGGKPEAIYYWKNWCNERNINNVIFTGYINDYSKIKYYQYSADILISYYTKQGHDVKYNLPNKICEYMLSGNIILTPNYPATRDLLTDNNCCFTIPENEVELSNSINFILENKEFMCAKAANAKHLVSEITFNKRGKLILDFLQKS